MDITKAKLRLSMLISKIEVVLQESDSKYINAEHILSDLRIIKQDIE